MGMGTKLRERLRGMLRRKLLLAALGSVLAPTLVIGLTQLPAANAATGGCSTRGCHHLMIKAPANADVLTIVSGTLSNGLHQGLACYELPAHKDTDWMGTGLEFQDNTSLHIALDIGQYSNKPCFAVGSQLREWKGSVPGADGADNIWVAP
jgi:hypothetical protein